MVKIEHMIQLSEPTESIPSSSTKTSAKAFSCKKKYKGVRMRSWGSWVSEIRAPNQKTRIWLGSYSTAEAAARAYDAALLCLKGASAKLNFPISSYSHHFPDSIIISPKSVQRVAAAAAAETVTTTTTNPGSPDSPLPPSTTSSPVSSAPSPYPSLSSSSDWNYHVQEVRKDNETVLSLPPNLLDSLSYNFDSPKYTDMINGSFFDPMMIDDAYEESDIRLWSFC